MKTHIIFIVACLNFTLQNKTLSYSAMSIFSHKFTCFLSNKTCLNQHSLTSYLFLIMDIQKARFQVYLAMRFQRTWCPAICIRRSIGLYSNRNHVPVWTVICCKIKCRTFNHREIIHFHWFKISPFLLMKAYYKIR